MALTELCYPLLSSKSAIIIPSTLIDNDTSVCWQKGHKAASQTISQFTAADELSSEILRTTNLQKMAHVMMAGVFLAL